MDSYGHRFDSITGRDSKTQKKKSSNHSSYYEDGERKPKFVSMLEFLVQVVVTCPLFDIDTYG